MGAGHSHRRERRGGDVVVPPVPRWILLGLLGLAGAATVLGLFTLWPDGDRVADVTDGASYAAPGVTFPRARVDTLQPACPPVEAEGGGVSYRPPAEEDACGRMSVTIVEGVGDGERTRIQVPPHVAESGLEAGDEVRLSRVPSTEGQGATYSYFGTERSSTLLLLAIAFVVVVAAVAWHRGVLALLGLGFSAWLIGTFLLPAVLGGESAPMAGLVASSAIMFVVLYTTHGFSLRTSTALAGTLVGLLITAAIGIVSVGATRLTGISDDSAGVLQTFAPDLDFQGLLACAVMIAGLGVLNDVTITQSSAVWELRAASATMSRTRLWASGMRIGRDHIASTIYTITFAYAGTALTVLLALQLYDLPVLELLSNEEIAQEVVRTLTTSIGLVLAVPITTAIAAVLVPGPRTVNE